MEVIRVRLTFNPDSPTGRRGEGPRVEAGEETVYACRGVEIRLRWLVPPRHSLLRVPAAPPVWTTGSEVDGASLTWTGETVKRQYFTAAGAPRQRPEGVTEPSSK